MNLNLIFFRMIGSGADVISVADETETDRLKCVSCTRCVSSVVGNQVSV